MTERAKILVLNQYYWPGVEATAQLLAQLCEALARDYDVTVVTGNLHGHEMPAEETRNGVRILRVRSTSYERSQLHLRAVELRELPRRHGPRLRSAASGPISCSA